MSRNNTAYTDQDWREFGLCNTDPNPDRFFPLKNQRKMIRDAQATCAQCPVKFQCLESSLKNREEFGIWGGVTEDDRFRLLSRTA